jgi:dihydroxy-acid dehydratase
MFTANSMNCLTEALGLSLPGNGSTLATHSDRKRLFVEAGHLIVDLARRYYEQDDETALPRSIATKKAFENAMSLDIAMGGSTNTILHILAAAHEGGVDFTLDDINAVAAGAGAVQGGAGQERRPHGRRAPRRRHHVDPRPARPGRAAQPQRADRSCRHHRRRARPVGHLAHQFGKRAQFYMAAPGGVRTTQAFSQSNRWAELDLDRKGRHPFGRTPLLQGWRPGRAQGQYRARRLRGEDRWR